MSNRLRVLFLGGTGVLSCACARELADRGDTDLTVVTRSRATPRPLPEGVRALHADIRDPRALDEALGGDSYDAVVDFIGYRPADVHADAARFTGRTGQYVYISTCSVYARPAPDLPITESTARRTGTFDYPRHKLACEEAVERAYRDDGLPAVIVRAAHVYDRTVLPLLCGWTAIERWRAGKPVVVHGDGTSLWNLLHARDFATGLAGLLGDHRTIGESVHIPGTRSSPGTASTRPWPARPASSR
jgi:nucleoside-diphosphate-sugar epimerase